MADFFAGKDELRKRALHALSGVGDRSQQWEEWTGKAYHVRRRLTEREQLTIGPAIDIRGTDEAERRLAPVRPILGPDWRE